MPNSFKIEWTETARKDLNELTDFIALDSIENALIINSKLISKVESPSWSPSRGRIVLELRKFGIEYYREILIQPYRIFFKIEDKSKVVILGILDGRRDLEQILLERIIK